MGGQLGARLVVLVSDTVFVHLAPGRTSIDYFNPDNMFSEVHVLAREGRLARVPRDLPIRYVNHTTIGSALRNLAPDIIRVFGADWTCDMACRYRLVDVPVVVSVDYRRPRDYHRSVMYADQVWCTSEAAKQSVMRSGVWPSQIRMLPNRVDVETFRQTPDPEAIAKVRQRLPSQHVVLFVGQRTETKNPETVIRALWHLPSRYHAVFIGRDDPEPYRRLAEQRGLSDRCHWISDVEKPELPAWYAAVSCLCVPSRWETIGNQVLEAAACGAPIIASDIPPINELLTHGVNGHLVRDYENPMAVARAIYQVAEDMQYRALLTTGASAAARPFDRTHVDQVERKLYSDALRMEPHRIGYDELWWRRGYELRQVLRHPGATLRRWILGDTSSGTTASAQPPHTPA